MKLDEIPIEYRDRVEFACRVCRADHKSKTGNNNNCAWRGCSNVVCSDIERVIADMEAEKLIEVCDSCGKHHKQPNSMLCKECEVKAGDCQ